MTKRTAPAQTELPGRPDRRLWHVVVPLKPLALAKSRLGPAAGEPGRGRLALAFALDTVGAALDCPAVDSVTVVTDDAEAAGQLAAAGARVVPDAPRAGLNAALAHGEQCVRAAEPGAAVAALNADLPALRPAELARVLAAAGGGRAFLADAPGVGTTLLAADAGAALAPGFGVASRARHLASGAREIGLRGVDSVRQDVDTGADLRAALALGVGPHTAAALDRLAVCGRRAGGRDGEAARCPFPGHAPGTRAASDGVCG
ncbi:2-phospho-L-lactate guanylyltransferase [Streptomyces sp. NBC_01808]|uniref:2-phospho-L-lactate guanylyltransferase n=1 Tax=Streptomyces sp. NBC_01808 TaxID=2975947 RepID=UPI002DDB37EE|nr:2-phospho-L-lactate guanylyltransferase [Streptomyces sp. NBC_01808]WSA40888.1 2-phospho-L-lactate guanylyltransferase [Streptomyces sp. NBC_01808]